MIGLNQALRSSRAQCGSLCGCRRGRGRVYTNNSVLENTEHITLGVQIQLVNQYSNVAQYVLGLDGNANF